MVIRSINYVFVCISFFVIFLSNFQFILSVDLGNLDYYRGMITRDHIEKFFYQNLQREQQKLLLYNLAKKTFEEHRAKFCIKKNPVIPKIIHVVWLGGKKIPDVCLAYLETWKQHHPDWRFMLWTDESLAQLTIINTDLFWSSRNMGERSDILRYELLYHFGGLYVDTDFECLHPFDFLHYECDFYTAYLPAEGEFVVANGLIAARAGHPLMLKIINELKNWWDNEDHEHIIERTGPKFFSKALEVHYATAPGVNIILPSNVVYPLSWVQSRDDVYRFVKPESIAIHHWMGTWK